MCFECWICRERHEYREWKISCRQDECSVYMNVIRQNYCTFHVVSSANGVKVMCCLSMRSSASLFVHRVVNFIVSEDRHFEHHDLILINGVLIYECNLLCIIDREWLTLRITWKKNFRRDSWHNHSIVSQPSVFTYGETWVRWWSKLWRRTAVIHLSFPSSHHLEYIQLCTRLCCWFRFFEWQYKRSYQQIVWIEGHGRSFGTKKEVEEKRLGNK